MRAEAEAVGAADAVVVAPAVLPVVGAVLLVPRLRIQAAVGPVRHIVLAQIIRVEEVARVVCSISARVAAVVGRVGRACAGAEERIVHALEVLDADVGVFACRGQGGVDGATKLDGAGEAGDGVRGVLLRVPVRPSDDDLEIGAPLAGIGGRFPGDS